MNEISKKDEGLDFDCYYKGQKAVIIIGKHGIPTYVEVESKNHSFKCSKDDPDFEKAVKRALKIMLNSQPIFCEVRCNLSGCYHEWAEEIRLDAKEKAEKKAKKLLHKYDF